MKIVVQIKKKNLRWSQKIKLSKLLKLTTSLKYKSLKQIYRTKMEHMYDNINVLYQV